MDRKNHNKAGNLIGLIDHYEEDIENFQSIHKKADGIEGKIKGVFSPYAIPSGVHMGGWIDIPEELVSDFLEQIRQFHVDNKLRLEKELEKL